MIRLGLALLVALLAWSTPAQAQSTWSLEITSPLPCDGAAEPDGTVSGARPCRAYPNIEYNVQIACMGGVYPYTYAVENGPAWLSVSNSAATAGILSGTPTNTTTDDDASITIRCTDALSATTTRTFGIDVTTSGQFFVDAVNGSDSNAGTLAEPWQTLAKVHSSTTAATDIVYFRGCTGCGTGANTWTYTTAGIAVDAADEQNGEEQVSWPSNRSEQWVGYPGESPRLDYGYTGDGCFPWDNPIDGVSPSYECGQSVPRIAIGSNSLYIDNFQLARCMVMCFEVNRANGRGAVFRRLTLMSIGPGIDGGNGSMATWERSSDHMTYGDMVFDVTLTSGGGQGGFWCGTSMGLVKTYDTHKFIFDRISVTQATTCTEPKIALKGGPFKTTIRNFTCTGGDASDICIGGNWAESDEPLHQQFSADIHHNLCLGTIGVIYARGCLVGNFSPGDFIEVFIWRNTFSGTMSAGNFDNSGPAQWKDNVIINSDTGGNWARLLETAIGSTTGWLYGTDASTADGNLLGSASDAIINAAGELQGVHLTNNGPTTGNPKGYQTSEATSSKRVPFIRREAVVH